MTEPAADIDVKDALALVAELGHFCGGQPATLAKELQLIRVIEDLIDVLVRKGVISISDLPEAAKLKLIERQIWRQQGQFGLKGNGDMVQV